MGTLGIKLDYEEASLLAKNMISEIKLVCCDYDIENVIVAGSLRRKKNFSIGDLDLILVTTTGNISGGFSNYLESLGFSIDAKGDKLVRSLTGNNVQIDFYSCTESELPFMLSYLTGPQNFNIGMRSQAKKLGYKLNQIQIIDVEKGTPIPHIYREEDLFKVLNLRYIEPEDRTDWYKNYKEYKLN